MKLKPILIICLTLTLIGCGDSNEYAIFRSGDMITIYWGLGGRERRNCQL